jgi:hypothetical protein
MRPVSMGCMTVCDVRRYISCNPMALERNLQGATCEQHEAAGAWRNVDGARPLLDTHEVRQVDRS